MEILVSWLGIFGVFWFIIWLEAWMDRDKNN